MCMWSVVEGPAGVLFAACCCCCLGIPSRWLRDCVPTHARLPAADLLADGKKREEESSGTVLWACLERQDNDDEADTAPDSIGGGCLNWPLQLGAVKLEDGHLKLQTFVKCRGGQRRSGLGVYPGPGPARLLRRHTIDFLFIQHIAGNLTRAPCSVLQHPSLHCPASSSSNMASS